MEFVIWPDAAMSRQLGQYINNLHFRRIKVENPWNLFASHRVPNFALTCNSHSFIATIFGRL